MKTKQIVLLVIYILLNIFIFTEALTPGDESTKQSSDVAALVSNWISKIGKDKFDYIEPTAIKITGNSELYVGEGTNFKATILPENTTNKVISWKSSDSDIASVSTSGYVYAKKEGKVTISATSEANKDIKNDFTITITKKTITQIPPTSINFIIEEEQKEMLNEATRYIGQYKVTFTPSTCNVKGVSYTSSNPEVAEIKNGVIYSKKSGVTTIKVTSDFDNAISDEFDLKVVETKANKPTSFDLDYDTDIYVNRPSKFVITSKREDLQKIDDDNKVVSITSENGGAARFEEGKGLIGIKKGTVKVTVTDLYSKSIVVSSNIIKVNNVNPESIEISTNSALQDLASGRSIKLQAKILPVDVTDKNIVWSVSDESIAHISFDGTILGLKKGSVEVMATHVDTGKVYKKTFEVFKASTLTAEEESKLHASLRKLLGHFSLFLVDGIVGFMFCMTIEDKKLRYILMFTFGVFFATVAEILQLIPKGRVFALKDILINNSGYLVGTLLSLLVYSIINKIRKKEMTKNEK